MTTLAEALNEARAVVARYVVLGSPEEYDTAALLAALAHCQGQDDLQYAPRLYVTKPVFGAGATTFRRLLAKLVHKPLMAGNITPAAIAHMMNEDPADPPVLLLDEAHLGKSEDLRRILNQGYERGQPYVKMAGKERVDVATFGIVIVTGIGSYLAEDTESRAIRISMQPARREEAERFTIAAEHESGETGTRLGDAVAPIAKLIATADPAMPEGLTPRAEDVWRGLIAVADQAGGEWPARARAAAVKLSAGQEARQDGPVRLLAELQAVFGDSERMTTAEILAKLARLPESRHKPVKYGDTADLNRKSKALAEELEPFEVRPRTIRIKRGTARGYLREWLEPLWDRYLPAPGAAEEPVELPREPAAVHIHPRPEDPPQRTEEPSGPPCIGGCGKAARISSRTCWEHAHLERTMPNRDSEPGTPDTPETSEVSTASDVAGVAGVTGSVPEAFKQAAAEALVDRRVRDGEEQFRWIGKRPRPLSLRLAWREEVERQRELAEAATNGVLVRKITRKGTRADITR